MYHFKECGLDNIYLKNGYEIIATEEGEAVGVHDLDNLYTVIAEGLASKPSPLTGKEFRFLRVEMDLSQNALGDLMDKSDQAIAKWEKGESPIPRLADKAVRDLYMETTGKGSKAGLLKILSQLDRELHELNFELEETHEGWKLQECA